MEDALNRFLLLFLSLNNFLYSLSNKLLLTYTCFWFHLLFVVKKRSMIISEILLLVSFDS